MEIMLSKATLKLTPNSNFEAYAPVYCTMTAFPVFIEICLKDNLFG